MHFVSTLVLYFSLRAIQEYIPGRWITVISSFFFLFLSLQVKDLRTQIWQIPFVIISSKFSLRRNTNGSGVQWFIQVIYLIQGDVEWKWSDCLIANTQDHWNEKTLKRYRLVQRAAKIFKYKYFHDDDIYRKAYRNIIFIT